MLEVSQLSVAFGRHRTAAVTDVSFTIEDGTRFGLIGESGSGKSVTALAVMGLLPENAHVTGSIKFNGTELVGAPDRVLRKLRGNELSMVFQEPMTALDPTMKVGKQLREVLTLHGRPNSVDLVDKALERVGLGGLEGLARTYPHELSGGQRQRVLIAMALMNDPALVICDEPTTALDVLVQADILKLLSAELESCLFITHDIAVMAQVCDQVAVMLEGKLVEVGAVRSVLTDPQHPYTAGLIATSQMQRKPGSTRLPVVDDYFDRAER